MFFDSHAHYNDEAFGDSSQRDALIQALFSSSVSYILNAGTNPVSSKECLKIAEKYENAYASVGIHPSDLYELSSPYDALDEIKKLSQHKKAVAIGEIGLDYHWHKENKELQKTFLDLQLSLAEELDMPVIIHDREAHGDCLEAVFAHPKVKGVFHSFSGSKESAKELIKAGWYISFSGVVTFKNASRLAETVPSIPLEKMLIETDCPYLTPHPFRGMRNDSSYLTYTAEKIASLHGTDIETVAKITSDNALKLFKIK